MKKIFSHTIGWDPTLKTGYFKAELEDGSTYLLQDLSIAELHLILEMLKSPSCFTDSAGWIISGWQNQY